MLQQISIFTPLKYVTEAGATPCLVISTKIYPVVFVICYQFCTCAGGCALTKILKGTLVLAGPGSEKIENHWFRLLCFIVLFSFQFPPDELLGKTAILVLLFYLGVQWFKLYTYSSKLGCYQALCQQGKIFCT